MSVAFLRTLNGQVTNLERYMPLLARKLGVPVRNVSASTERPPVFGGRGRSTGAPKRANSRRAPSTRCWDCAPGRPAPAVSSSSSTLKPVTFSTPRPAPSTTHRSAASGSGRKRVKAVKKPGSRTSTSTRPNSQLSIRLLSTTPSTIRFSTSTQKPTPTPSTTKKSPWEKFTIGQKPRLPDAEAEQLARGLVRPAEQLLKVVEEEFNRPWTHRERRPNIDCPEANVSPIEVAIVWVSGRRGRVRSAVR